MIVETVPTALDGERLDRVVSMVAGCSRSQAATLVDDGQVAVDDAVTTSRAMRLSTGQQVSVDYAGDEEVVGPEPGAGDLVVVYEDADVVIIDKPPGLVVHPGAGNHDGTLVNRLLSRYPEMASVGDPSRPGIVHRLDKDTSGLLVVARSEAAYGPLVAALKARRVERVYRSLAWGVVSNDGGLIDAPVGRSQREPTRMTVTPRGKVARTEYRVIARGADPEVTLVQCRLQTGRTHQIRVHLQSIGHPVVGDRRYGGERPGLRSPRPWLHAAELGFTHPVTGEQVAAESPVPPDLEAVLALVAFV